MNKLNESKDIAILVFLRIAFGILAISEMLAQLTYKRWYKGYYDPEEFGFSYIGFEWIQPFPEPFMSTFMIVVLLAAVGILLGYRYRWSASIFALGFTYIYLMEKGLYLNHGYLFCWLSFVMILLPAQRGWSLDLKHGRAKDKATMPLWVIFLPVFLMGIVYFYGGLAKMNEDWLNGIPLIKWVGYKKDMWLLGPIWGNPKVGLFMAWSGMLLDTLAAFMLLWKRTRWLAMGLLILFHLTNALIFSIGIFPWMSLSLSTLFFPSNWPRQQWAWLSNKLPKLCHAIENFGRPEAPQLLAKENRNMGRASFALLLLFVFVHLTVPHRHHFFEGDVAWTEEGHRYSWRMMLRHKMGKGKFIVKGKDQKQLEVRPTGLMNGKFSTKMYTHPDMIWQTAQHIKEMYEAKGWEDIEVYADIKAKLNYRKFHRLVDDKVDLTKVKWNCFEKKDWILPEGSNER